MSFILHNMQFKAYAITNEIDLNSIATECNIPKKYTWEEPLILQGSILSTIMQKKIPKEQKVLIFSFGSIVFINTHHPDVTKFMEYLKSFEPEIDINNYKRYADDYELRMGEVTEMEFTDKYALVPNHEFFHPELVSIVIAKSVALEKIEAHLEKILDRLENMIDRLEKGKLRIGNKELARTTATVARHGYNTISYVMILDKPDITWINGLAADFYDQMAEFFELNDRFEIIKQKTDVLNNIIEGFSSISHSMRGLFVEWVVVILIILEVILMVAELLK